MGHRAFPLTSLPCSVTLLFISISAAQADDTNCLRISEPADSSYEFTENLSRWGTQSSYNIDGKPHQVRSITVNRLPVFDESNPDENNAVYRWANDIHIFTREQVVIDQLLFHQDDVVDSGMLAESERLLRRNNYLSDATIRVLQDCDNEVDLEVVSREVWSLAPEISYKTTGGHSSSEIGIRDSNFLGTGQLLAFNYKQDLERDSYGLTFKNPNIKGSRYMFSTELASKSDGHYTMLETGLPFYSLDARRAWTIQLESVLETLGQYQYGVRQSEVIHENRQGEISMGFSRGREEGWVKRLTTGLRFEDHAYTPTESLMAPANFPDDRQFIYPFVQYEWLEDNYAMAYNISQIYRTEDLHIGKYLRNSLGYSPGVDSGLIVDGQYSDTLIYQPKHLLQLSADWGGRWDQDARQWKNGLMHMRLDFHRGQTANRTLFLGLEATHTLNLDNGRQVILGGSNGLRGYDTNFLAGTGSIEFTAEQRLFTRFHPFNLLRVGFAAFYDVGKVFGNDIPGGSDTYQDVGFGLRLAPSKSESGHVIHLDLAYPLNQDIPGVKSLQFIAEVKKSF